MFDKGNKVTELFWYRMILCTGVIGIPLFGYLAVQSAPGSVEFMSQRYAMAGLWGLAFALSFVSFYIKERLITITCWLALGLHLWVIWIVYLNNFSIEYTVGLVTTFSILNIALRRPRLYYWFIISAVVLTEVAVFAAPQPKISAGIFSFSIVVLALAFMLTSKAVLTFEKKLSKLNETLEKKVAERTAEAENRSRQLAVKNQELEQFAYVASHDLKSPLRNIGSFVQLIQRKLDGTTDSDLNDYLSFVLNSVKKMNDIINDVLLYSRFGQQAATFEMVPIGEVIDEVCQMLGNEIKQKKVEIHRDIQAGQVCCDRRQMEQLLRNLLDNAIKYNDSSRPVLKISVVEKRSEYLFSVKDNGIGIPLEYQAKIFKMFQRLHNDNAYSGTGVGLAVCKRIVENHQGEIWIHSQPGHGTTFFFAFGKSLNTFQHEIHFAETLP
jgi:signal transduction histidine kinase